MVDEKVNVLEIRKVICNGLGSSVADPAIGIAHYRLMDSATITIRILQKNKQKQFIFPFEYEMSCAEALQYPTRLLPDGFTIVHIVPIKRLTQLLTKCNPPFGETMRKANSVAKKMAAKENNLRATIEPTWD
jgi:hypothetical protein